MSIREDRVEGAVAWLLLHPEAPYADDPLKAGGFDLTERELEAVVERANRTIERMSKQEGRA